MGALDNYQLLIQKLDQFIRKFYINQLIRGGLYSIGLILFLFLAFNILEYYYYFSPSIRKAMFYSFLGTTIVSLFFWVALPLLHYFRLGKVISHQQAAQIIGEHFPDVKDKLLNILQLRRQADVPGSSDLILASVNQKSEEIKPVPFKAAINLYQNKKYLRYALPPLMLLFIILFGAPSILKDGLFRLWNNNKEFEAPAPFSFNIENKNMKVVQFGDYTLKVKVDGKVLPNEVFIDIDNYQYRLQKEDANIFTYKFSNVQKNQDFKLFSGAVTSKEYNLEVLKKPNIVGFDVQLQYPAYVGRNNEQFNNVGDLSVPAGTNISWVFNALNTDNIAVRFSGNNQAQLRRQGDEVFTMQKRATADEIYKIFISNAQLPNADSVSYTLTVIPDLYPTINVEKFEDSTRKDMVFFVGDASDDYGLRSLSFNYKIKSANGAQGQVVSKALNKPDAKQIQYNFTWDLNDLQLKPGDEVTYYFETFDNDGVNGSKSARTNIMSYAMPTLEQLEKKTEDNNQDIKDQLKAALKESKKIQEDMKKLQEKLMDKKEIDWQSKKEMEKLMNRQKELDSNIEDAKQKFDENLKNQNQFSETDERIQKKQEQVQKLFEELQNDEMKELMKQIEEMMQKMEKDQALDKIDEMKLNDEELEKELDRMEELFKQMEVESQLEQITDKLEELGEKEEKLGEQTEKNEKSEEESKKEQEDIKKDFDKLMEKLDETEKKNKELEKPLDINKEEELQQDIQKDMKESKESLEQKDGGKAGKKQKSAGQKMKDMAGQMKQSMQGGEMEQAEEDIKALRQLLENLVNLSFDQEALMADFGKTAETTPRYVKLTQQQYKLKDDFVLIQDSLQALSKRVYQIESFVTEKVTEINQNMRSSVQELEDRKKPQALDHQQRTMKNVNDLALMLSETMQQMQQQMSSMMEGNKSCKKPGKGQGGSVPKDKIGEGQKSLNQQMKDMKEKMQGKSGKGGSGSSKEFAQMAAKQAALRKALQEKQKEMQQRGQGGKETQEMIDLMDKVETELVNKQLSNETLRRQEEILTRLLENEKAEREREYDNKRKADAARDYEKRMPPNLEEYVKKRQAEIEMYKTVSPALKPYYKNLVEDYFEKLKGSK